jgi:outer membrane protein TolC
MMAVTAALPALAAVAASGGSETAAARVAAVQRAAVASSPALAAGLREAALLGAEARTEAAALSPHLEWQSEGLGGDRTPNAQDTLRLGTPFNFFGQGGPARDLARAAGEGTEAIAHTTVRAVAVESTRRWLALAAAVERVEVRRQRLERLDAALTRLEARHRLGEVSGTEVAQLDLDRTSAASLLAAAEAAVEVQAEGVAELCGPGFPRPQPGDLEALAELSSTPDAARIVEEAVAVGVPMQRARSEAELEEARARMAAATAWGRPMIEVEWERFPTLDGLDGYDAWGFRLAVPLPIGSAGARQREAARERQALAAAARDAALAETVRGARSALTVATGAASRLRSIAPALDGLGRIEESLFAQYRLGALSYLEYVYGVFRHDELLLGAIDARTELLLARLDLGYLLDDPSLFPMAALSMEEGS